MSRRAEPAGRNHWFRLQPLGTLPTVPRHAAQSAPGIPIAIATVTIVVLTVSALVVIGVASPTTPPATPTPTITSPTVRTLPSGGVRPAFTHVVEVVMENLSYTAAMATPGLAALAHRYAWASDSFATSHPSLPNYLALTSGQTFGISTDCLGCYVSADNLGAQLSAAHVSWADYVDGVRSACHLGTSSGVYAAKHNPFRYYADVRSSRSLCAHLVPLAALAVALRAAATTPRFAFVVPDICHDGHDCPAASAASWLTGFLGTVTASAAWRDHGLVLVTWDEAPGDNRQVLASGHVLASGGGGHVLTLVVAPGVPRGTELRAPLSGYGLLATVEHDFGLASLGGAAAWSGHTMVVP